MERISGQFQYLHCVRNESGSTRTAPACQTSTIRLAHASGATNAEVVCELCCGSQDPHNAFRRNAGHAGCGSFKASTYKEHETKYHGAANCVWNVGRKYVNHMAATEIIMQMAAVLREWINEHARTSRALGLMIDESTDISNKQAMLLLCGFVSTVAASRCQSEAIPAFPVRAGSRVTAHHNDNGERTLSVSGEAPEGTNFIKMVVQGRQVAQGV